MSPRHGGGYQVLQEAGLTPVDGISRAVRALRRYAEWRGRLAPANDRAATERHAEEPLAAAASTGRALSYGYSKRLLAVAGVRTPEESFATTPDEAAAAAESIDNPVAMKLVAPGLIHKTEVGGVRLGIRGAAAAAAAFDDMTSPARLSPYGVVAEGVFVQEMVADGLDLLVSAHDDEVFGPVLTIGAGGVAAEVDNDAAHLAIPFDEAEFLRALRGLRLWPLLAGFRGRPARDVGVLARAARGIADAFASGEPALAEIEVNPLRVVVEDGVTCCIALDIVALGR
jgi:acyl-CoA synthetase (NDP forming)